MIIFGHQKQREFFKKKFELNQLSHAYLFVGNKEIGKKTFAIELAELVGCKFPDLLIVKPDQGKEISILKIREVQNFLAYKSYNGGFKIVIVDDAEKMNQEAQSCFLKTLEEPKGKTLLILISSKPDMLLPTITSRCQTIKFFRPKGLPLNSEKLKREQEILKDLLLVINSDLSDKFKYAKSLDFEQQKLSDILEVMQKYLRHLLFAETGVGKINEQENFFDETPHHKNYSVQKIKNIINLIEDINNKLLFTNANPKLALEILLIEF
jgi:DNA polymerase III subunit delta'